MYRKPDAQWQSSAVVADNVYRCSNMLPTHASESSAATAIKSIRDLKERDIGHYFCSELDDFHVVVEDLGIEVFDSHKNSQHKRTE